MEPLRLLSIGLVFSVVWTVRADSASASPALPAAQAPASSASQTDSASPSTTAPRKFKDLSLSEIKEFMEQAGRLPAPAIFQAGIDADRLEHDEMKSRYILSGALTAALRERAPEQAFLEQLKSFIENENNSRSSRVTLIYMLADAKRQETALLLLEIAADTRSDPDLHPIVACAVGILGTAGEQFVPLLEEQWRNPDNNFDQYMLNYVATGMANAGAATSLELLLQAVLIPAGQDEPRRKAARDALDLCKISNPHAIPPLAARLSPDDPASEASKLACAVLLRMKGPAARALVAWMQKVGDAAAPLAQNLASCSPEPDVWQAALQPAVPFRSEKVRAAIRSGLDAAGQKDTGLGDLVNHAPQIILQTGTDAGQLKAFILNAANSRADREKLVDSLTMAGTHESVALLLDLVAPTRADPDIHGKVTCAIANLINNGRKFFPIFEQQWRSPGNDKDEAMLNCMGFAMVEAGVPNGVELLLHAALAPAGTDDVRKRAARMVLRTLTPKPDAIPFLAAHLSADNPAGEESRLAGSILERMKDPATQMLVSWMEKASDDVVPLARSLAGRSKEPEIWKAALDPKVSFRSEEVRAAIRTGRDEAGSYVIDQRPIWPVRADIFPDEKSRPQVAPSSAEPRAANQKNGGLSALLQAEIGTADLRYASDDLRSEPPGMDFWKKLRAFFYDKNTSESDQKNLIMLICDAHNDEAAALLVDIVVHTRSDPGLHRLASAMVSELGQVYEGPKDTKLAPFMNREWCSRDNDKDQDFLGGLAYGMALCSASSSIDLLMQSAGAPVGRDEARRQAARGALRNVQRLYPPAFPPLAARLSADDPTNDASLFACSVLFRLEEYQPLVEWMERASDAAAPIARELTRRSPAPLYWQLALQQEATFRSEKVREAIRAALNEPWTGSVYERMAYPVLPDSYMPIDTSGKVKIELQGVSGLNGQRQFTFFIPETGDTERVGLGGTFLDWKVDSFREKDGVLVLTKDDGEEELDLTVGKVEGVYPPDRRPPATRRWLTKIKASERKSILEQFVKQPLPVILQAGIDADRVEHNARKHQVIFADVLPAAMGEQPPSPPFLEQLKASIDNKHNDPLDRALLVRALGAARTNESAALLLDLAASTRSGEPGLHNEVACAIASLGQAHEKFVSILEQQWRSPANDHDRAMLLNLASGLAMTRLPGEIELLQEAALAPAGKDDGRKEAASMTLNEVGIPIRHAALHVAERSSVASQKPMTQETPGLSRQAGNNRAFLLLNSVLFIVVGLFFWRAFSRRW